MTILGGGTLFCLPQSVIWKWLSWVLSFRISHKAEIKVSSKTVFSSEDLIGEGSASQLSNVVVCKIRFLKNCYTDALISSLVAGQLPPQFLARWASPTWHVISLNFTSLEINKETVY